MPPRASVLATAKAFAEAGAAVTLADVHEDAVRSAVEEMVAASHKAIAVRCNVADEAEVAAMVEPTDPYSDWATWSARGDRSRRSLAL